MKIKFIIKYYTKFGENIALFFKGRQFPMTWGDGGLWSAELELPKGRHEYCYKLVGEGGILREETLPHVIEVPSRGDDRVEWDSWQDRPRRYYAGVSSVFGGFGARAAGVSVPVFSLRSRGSFGVGDFEDLKFLVKFAAKCSFKCIQLLPINDTTRDFSKNDSYPYSACSSFALHPQFVNLEKAGLKADREYTKLQKELNALDSVDYERVNLLKDKYMRQLFGTIGKAELAGAKAKSFINNNAFWLKPYACFRALSVINKTADFTCWGEMADFSVEKLQKFYKANKDEVDYHVWVQFVLDRQLSETVAFAAKNGVFFKGDLPIGVGRFSADCWHFPQLFNMDSSAGAPPDYFSRDGQNWGFPTYNWDAMAKDGYAWWKARLGKMSEYFSAYRIDHILGFFRIWEIPYSQDGLCGMDVSGLYGHFNPSLPYTEKEIEYFDRPENACAAQKHPLFFKYPRKKGGYVPGIGSYDNPEFVLLNEDQKRAFNYLYTDFFHHRHDEFWKVAARKKLSAVTKSTSMLSCGEDLGMLADCVPGVMDEMNVLSLELPRMPKGNGREFGTPLDYPVMSVCTTSTHDMSPMRLWWKQCPEQAEHFYRNILRKGGEFPVDPSAEVCRDIVRNIMYSPSMLCIIPLQDYLACSDAARLPFDDLEREQINNPADSHNYWRYRMNLCLEDLTADDDLCVNLKRIAADSGR